MNLLDLMTGPWAILPETLVELQSMYAARLHGEKIDIAAVENRLGRPLVRISEERDRPFRHRDRRIRERDRAFR
ncbi:MAG: hypothetical protein Q8N44_07085 [Rubrivivax sp.]|nr:hypothetical protein [Rubrivivax sp.]